MVAILFLLVTTMVLAFAAGLDSRIPPGGHWWSSRKNRVILLYVALVGIVFVAALSKKIYRSITYSGSLQAVAEIRDSELALTKILSDAGRSSLLDLFDPVAFEKTCAWYEIQYDADAFEARTAICTRAAYALIVSGRNAMQPEAGDDDIMANTRKVLAIDVVDKIDTSYHLDLGNDPWGNPYQFFPGPWPGNMGPVLFRAYAVPGSELSLPGDSTPTADPLTVTIAGEDLGPRGFPASRNRDLYIWSLGANGVSDQPRYDPTHQYAPPARQHYRIDAPDEYLGGGDDINNWDKDQTFLRFYN